MSRVGARPWQRLGLFTSATIIALATIAPILWMIDTSFKSTGGAGKFPPSVFPSPFTLSNYEQLFSQYGLQGAIWNSAIITAISTFFVLLFGSMAGYALGRLPIQGKRPILVILLIISVFPEISVISPLYILLRNLGWLNSYQALIVPYTAFNLPFAIWILRNYFLAIPREMEDVCLVEGISSIRTLFSIILPQATPGLFVAGIFTLTACWSEFLMALTFNSTSGFHTIPVAITTFGTQFTVPYGTIFAASMVSILPIAILVLVFRRSVISGLTQGAVKG